MSLDCTLNVKLRAQECKEFAMWFAVNWEYHDSTSDGHIYIYKAGNKVTSSIDDIFNKWLNSYTMTAVEEILKAIYGWTLDIRYWNEVLTEIGKI